MIQGVSRIQTLENSEISFLCCVAEKLLALLVSFAHRRPYCIDPSLSPQAAWLDPISLGFLVGLDLGDTFSYAL